MVTSTAWEAVGGTFARLDRADGAAAGPDTTHSGTVRPAVPAPGPLTRIRGPLGAPLRDPRLWSCVACRRVASVHPYILWLHGCS